MTEREKLRKLLLRSRKVANTYMRSICTASSLSYTFFHEQLYQYVLAKFLLTDEDRPQNDDFHALAEISLAKSMRISPELVEEFDTAQSCDGVTSVMAKKVLLFMAIQKALGIELPAQDSARVKTMQDLSSMVWKVLEREPAWKKRMVG